MGPVARRVIAVVLGYAGVVEILYAPLVPFLPPLIERPWPAAAMAYGLALIVTAVGLVRHWPAAREAAVALVLAAAAMHVIIASSLVPIQGSGMFVDLGVLIGELVVDATMLAFLLRARPDGDADRRREERPRQALEPPTARRPVGRGDASD